MDVLHIPWPLENYLFMGCWNKNGCSINRAGQEAVAKAIRREPADWPLFLGGDNVYPDKIDGKKTYDSQRVLDGLKCLQGSKWRHIFGTVGNHNIADKTVLATELQAAAWTMRTDPYCLLFSNKRAIIFLNSNWLDDDALGDEGRDMLEALTATLHHLGTAGISYTLVMHHPLISLKKAGYYILPQHAALLDCLIKAPVLPTMLLVADTHNYQRGIVEWKGHTIRQVVVGTGGADLDPITVRKSPTRSPLRFGGNYTAEETAVSYGYLRVLSTAATAEFVSVRPTPTRRTKSPSPSNKL